MTEINIKDNKRIICENNKIPSLDIDEWSCDWMIYKIPLDMLYYNDWNTRIVTAKSKYESENDVKLSDLFNQGKIEEYNKIIHQLVKNWNLVKFKSTLWDIEKFWQKEIWYVLSDWRVIDWNRRFTCLRELKQTKGLPKFDYFRAVIIDKDTADPQQIKNLEIRTQLWKDEKVWYDPIDEYIWLYLDVKEWHTNIENYATSRKMTDKAVEKMMNIAKLIVEYLDFINASWRYYIAQESKLYWLFVEAYNRTAKIRDNKEWRRDAKIAIFDWILLKWNWDKVREIRPFIDDIILKKERFNNFFDEYYDSTCKLHDILDGENNVTNEFISKNIRNKNEFSKKIDNLVEEYWHEASIEKEKNEPLKVLEKTNKEFNKLDYDLIPRLKGSLKEDFLKELWRIQDKVDEIKDIINKW